MKKIDKAVEIVRGWSDEKLATHQEIMELLCLKCPSCFGMRDYFSGSGARCSADACEDCWNGEVEE